MSPVLRARLLFIDAQECKFFLEKPFPAPGRSVVGGRSKWTCFRTRMWTWRTWPTET